MGTFKRLIPNDRSLVKWDGADLVFGDVTDSRNDFEKGSKLVCLHMCTVRPQNDGGGSMMQLIYSHGRTREGRPGSLLGSPVHTVGRPLSSYSAGVSDRPGGPSIDSRGRSGML